MKKLTALLRLALALLRSSGFTLTHERLPDGRDKIQILRAVDRAREFVPLRLFLWFLRLSASRFHAWRRLQDACALDDRSSCPHTSPHRLTPREVLAIKDTVTAVEYRHVSTRHARRPVSMCHISSGPVVRSPTFGFAGCRRSRGRRQPYRRTETVIRLLDGTRAYLHAVIDNFSRRILAWRVLEGSLALTIDGKELTATPGTIVRMPSSVPHAVRAPEPARTLLLMLRE